MTGWLAQYWPPIAVWVLAIVGAWWWGELERRGTLVCPTCGGLGRVRPPADGAGRE